ncbi:hypothetical protein CLOBY_04510 [Clostridium saccharobutylicum]|uniref:hypothetical protein n=1 Tax=Clostridium saccharobutylicum TaxID=169679 RepID=UPI000983D499|nr:hypothetical protein [Clostridium saccharobutylicum]AQS08360.1 hypothetical protein CLOBY_04510 [Clostridium saccharobutylicum]MBC2438304.1 hypothetical protein [Clostridium saccharobutylicum]NSB88276.1 hypothetical protein [Clostridium saccharobutylicum]NYC29309.1 hypothetical protein [Clostridium saccharobutylicum]OOM17855.1 hypothetical protein CLSAB_12690 [Clostridium saccharobutylicum]
MNFLTNIFELNPHKDIKVKLLEVKMPHHKDIFFRAKQDEIFQQYESARIFLNETETKDWNHWFQNDDLKNQELFELLFMERMYEASLMYYNIMVDLSWTLCYVSAEYALYQKDNRINMNNMMNIEEAYDAMRKAENLVTNPNSEGNPFEYLKMMCPEFKQSIDLIIDFWKKFNCTNIRTLYNFIKHKGKPMYKEVNKFYSGRLMGLVREGKNYPTDIRDVQKEISLKESIEELKQFDDAILFPYIKELFRLLEIAVDPSPLIF